MERAIITACSNKFFPSVINLLTSIKVNFPNHPPIFVYDLGLFSFFRKELESVYGVKLIKMPEFCQHWRSCYTWKTYIFAHPLAEANLYLDAGCEVVKPLDSIFAQIEENKLFLVDQGENVGRIWPKSYQEIFGLSNHQLDNERIFAAGIFGFIQNVAISDVLSRVFQAGVAGLCLGFSPKDRWRNRGVDKSTFVRDCELFRHDMTLLNLFFRLYYKGSLSVCGAEEGGFVPENYIKQIRLGYKYPRYLRMADLHKRFGFKILFNRFCIYLFSFLKIINKAVKEK